jgi:hypothetical protein
MTDYRLSKLFYDLHNDPKLAAEYRADMPGFLDRYGISPQMRNAIMTDDVGAIAPHVNAYLLRFYFQVRGMPQPEFMARLSALADKSGQPQKEAAHG